MCLRLPMSSISIGARSVGGGALDLLDARGDLERLQLGHDLGGDRVELRAGLEVGLVVDDPRLELLVAELERDVGERHLRARRHVAVVAWAPGWGAAASRARAGRGGGRGGG